MSRQVKPQSFSDSSAAVVVARDMSLACAKAQLVSDVLEYGAEGFGRVPVPLGCLPNPVANLSDSGATIDVVDTNLAQELVRRPLPHAEHNPVAALLLTCQAHECSVHRRRGLLSAYVGYPAHK